MPTDKFDAFIKKEKFVEDMSILYPGISKPELRETYSGIVNETAIDFRKIASGGNPNKQAYLAAVKTALDRFRQTEVMYDTEDKERAAGYMQELLELVGVESSDGILNSFLYGFDPNDGLK